MRKNRLNEEINRIVELIQKNPTSTRNTKKYIKDNKNGGVFIIEYRPELWDWHDESDIIRIYHSQNMLGKNPDIELDMISKFKKTVWVKRCQLSVGTIVPNTNIIITFAQLTQQELSKLKTCGNYSW